MPPMSWMPFILHPRAASARAGANPEQAAELLDLEVAEHGALAGEAQARGEVVGRQAQAQTLCRTGLGGRAADPHRAGAAHAAAATVERLRHVVVARQARSEQHHAQVGGLEALDRPPREAAERARAAKPAGAGRDARAAGATAR